MTPGMILCLVGGFIVGSSFKSRSYWLAALGMVVTIIGFIIP